MLAISLILLTIVVVTNCQDIGNGTVVLSKNGVISKSNTGGIAQVYINKQWLGICKDDVFGATEASTICYQLGYSAALQHSAASPSNTSNGTKYIAQLDCGNGDFQVISQCRFSIQTGCSQGPVDISCSSVPAWNNPFPGMVRLTGGVYSSQGLVEVYCNDQWGTICDDGIDDDEADTICLQLGYNDAVKWDSLLITGNSTQPVWFDNFYCGHTRTSCIGYCGVCPIFPGTRCKHKEDMTVICTVDGTRSQVGSLRSTCIHVATNPLSLKIIIIIGVAGLIVLIAGCFLVISIILCICCCKGVGIGAASMRGKKGKVYAQFD